MAALDRLGIVPGAVGTQEGLTLGVETGRGLRASKVSEVVAPFAVLGLVVDHSVDHLDLSGGEVALKVGGVIPGIPQAELQAGKDVQRPRFGAAVGERQVPHLEVFTQRDEIARAGFHPLVEGFNDSIAQAVAAGIAFEGRTRGLPAR